MTEEALTVEEAAARLKVLPKTVRIWLREGRLPGVKLGRHWRIAASTIDKVILGDLALGSNESNANDHAKESRERHGEA